MLQDNRMLLLPWMIVVTVTAVVDVSHIMHVLITEVCACTVLLAASLRAALWPRPLPLFLGPSPGREEHRWPPAAGRRNKIIPDKGSRLLGSGGDVRGRTC